MGDWNPRLRAADRLFSLLDKLAARPLQNRKYSLIAQLTEEVKFPKGRKISQEFQEFTYCILNKNPK